MTNIRMGARVARNLQTTEHAVDAAMVATSCLIQTMLEARADARLAAEVGQVALSEMVSSLSQLNDVRQAVVAGHRALAEVADNQGIAWRLEGPLEEKVKPTAVVVSVAA
ncbi:MULTISPECIES: hypothetical protein [unclassified Brevundimonas]|uniref:hypothetical protein n=1 Tax=unclassified Brevundimonas TaxID=2622653 RepID=UPI0025B7B727|nr:MULTISPECIES: hypothetical protein [unclassified Brevundimonas]